MAKPKLTKEAIRFIIETYDSQTENYTYSDVANLVRDKYLINISTQAVQQNYHKYKGNLKVSNKNERLERERDLHQKLYVEKEKLNNKEHSIKIKIQIN